jgi:hypothetical protein
LGGDEGRVRVRVRVRLGALRELRGVFGMMKIEYEVD